MEKEMEATIFGFTVEAGVARKEYCRNGSPEPPLKNRQSSRNLHVLDCPS